MANESHLNGGVLVYTMDYCPFCENAKRLLKQRGVPFTEKKLEMDDEAGWVAAEKRSGMKSMPMIFNGNTLIGGYQQLAALDAQDQLQSLKAKS